MVARDANSPSSKDLSATDGCNTTSHACTSDQPDGLTDLQHSAIDLLTSGKTDTETARRLKIHRTTVTRWRLYSPAFRAELAARRAGVWGAAADQLRALLPKALDVLNRALEDDYSQVDVALALVKLARALPVAPTDPSEANKDTHPDGEHEPAHLEHKSAEESTNGQSDGDAAGSPGPVEET
jgi:hypothetical protein